MNAINGGTNRKCVLLYSGGTDSTLAACLLAEKFDEVILLTFSRFGLFTPGNAALNAGKLLTKYGGRITHETLPVDGLFKKVSYDRYFRNLFKYGFFLLSTCGLCKLAMHIRAAVYCLDNGVKNLADGANKGMHLFPDQQPGMISMLRGMHSAMGISYENPVFDFEGPQDIDFADRFHLERLPGLAAEKDGKFMENKKRTTGYRLFELGLMPSDNIKGTELDRKMQPRCFQFILFNIWLHWYYLPFSNYEKYVVETNVFFGEKIKRFSELLAEYREKGESSVLTEYL